MPDLTILYTGDLHGKLRPEAVERIKAEKAACGNCLLLDAGDAVSSGNIYWRPGGEPILAQMSEMGYDAMALGNREFHFLRRGLESKVSLAGFPVLSANLRCKSDTVGDSGQNGDPLGGPPLPCIRATGEGQGEGRGAPMVLPSIALEFSGLRVVVFGLTVPMISGQKLARMVSPYWFEEPAATAAEIVPVLREAADVLIALTHVGIKVDAEIASKVEGIDLIVGGHTHIATPDPTVVNRTSIVHSGWYGRCIGRAQLTSGVAGVEVTNSLIDLETVGDA